jgi:predicted nucleic acid-binding protein
LDASVSIAAEAGRPLSRHPVGQARVSVVTLAERRLGALRSDGALRELREATLSSARRFVPLAVTELVADELAALLAKLRAAQLRAKASTASSRPRRSRTNSSLSLRTPISRRCRRLSRASPSKSCKDTCSLRQ